MKSEIVRQDPRRQDLPAQNSKAGRALGLAVLEEKDEVSMVHDCSSLIRFLVAMFVLVGGVIASATAQQQARTSPPERAATSNPGSPDRPDLAGRGENAVSTEQAQYLVRSALLTLNDANRSGNYTVLRDLAAPDFQARNTAADLAQSFSDLRHRNFDLFATALLAPQFITPPGVDASGRMRLIGFFPTRPLQISFELVFQSIGGQWRLFAMSVSTPQADAPHARLHPPELQQDAKSRNGILKDAWWHALARPSTLTIGRNF